MLLEMLESVFQMLVLLQQNVAHLMHVKLTKNAVMLLVPATQQPTRIIMNVLL
jgi:hypothetical protein